MGRYSRHRRPVFYTVHPMIAYVSEFANGRKDLLQMIAYFSMTMEPIAKLCFLQALVHRYQYLFWGVLS